MRANATIDVVPPWSLGCDREGLHLVARNGGYQVATHTDCTCNELRALVGRHLISRGAKFDLEYFKTQTFDLPILDVEKISKLEFIKSYSGAKRRSYSVAYEKLKEVIKVDNIATVKMFVKPDKYVHDDILDKCPRAIQYRTPQFNLLVGAFLKPYEEEYYHTQMSNIGLRMIAKGMNNYERADNIVSASREFDSPVFLLLDHSKFDSCVNEHYLKWTHRQYVRTYRNRFLRYLLSKTIFNKGYSFTGVRYRVRGTRMSGDYDTALGNCLVNQLLLSSWLKEFKHHILLDGDDSVVILEKRDLKDCMDNFVHFEKMGFDTKCEVVYELSDVEFCRSRLLPLDPPRFARDPVRVLSHWNVANTFVNTDTWVRYLAGVGCGELCLNAGVPILGPCARKLANLHKKPLVLSSYRYAGNLSIGSEVITDEARVLFQQVYGISPAEQIITESTFDPKRPKEVSDLVNHFCSLRTSYVE